MQSRHWLKSTYFLFSKGVFIQHKEVFSSFLKIAACLLLFHVRGQSQMTALQLDFKCVCSLSVRHTI